MTCQHVSIDSVSSHGIALTKTAGRAQTRALARTAHTWLLLRPFLVSEVSPSPVCRLSGHSQTKSGRAWSHSSWCGRANGNGNGYARGCGGAHCCCTRHTANAPRHTIARLCLIYGVGAPT